MSNNFYLTSIPNDIRYIIWSYLGYPDLLNIEKSFDICINFEKLVLITEPDFYVVIRKMDKNRSKPVWWNVIYNDSMNLKEVNLYYEYQNMIRDDKINTHTLNYIGYYKINKEFPEFINIIEKVPLGNISWFLFYITLLDFFKRIHGPLDKYLENIDTLGKFHRFIGENVKTIYEVVIVILSIKNKEFLKSIIKALDINSIMEDIDDKSIIFYREYIENLKDFIYAIFMNKNE